MKHSRLRAQVAPYLEAIKKARKEGAMWGEIGELLGMSDKQVRLAVKFCRYEVEQIPLPEPEPAPRPPARQAPLAQKAADTASQGGKVFFNSLPKIGGKQP